MITPSSNLSSAYIFLLIVKILKNALIYNFYKIFSIKIFYKFSQLITFS